MAAGSRRAARAWAAVGLRAGDGVVNAVRACSPAWSSNAGGRGRLWTRIHAIVAKDGLRSSRRAGDADSGWRVELPTQGGVGLLSASRRACAGSAPAPPVTR